MNHAIELTATLENPRQIRLDDPLPGLDSGRVRLIVLLPAVAATDGETSESEVAWLRAAAGNEAFAFLANPEEDIYTAEDGQPVTL